MNVKWLTLAMLACSGSGQAQGFPADLLGGWCSVHNEGSRVDIAEAEYEESDGVCRIRDHLRNKGEQVVIFTVHLTCDMGVEGKRPFSATERYTVFKIGAFRSS